MAMADGRADLAVHSLKDVPMDMPDGFALAAITAREDPRDAFVSNRFLDLAGLPGGARVGTSSLRREAQLRERDPLLSILPLRGNVNTRLRKLDEGQYEGIILAAAGLKRLGLVRSDRLVSRPGGKPARGRAGRAGRRMPRRSHRRPGGARAARRPRHDARHDRGARLRAGAVGELSHAARRPRGVRSRRALAARVAREPRRRRNPARRASRALRRCGGGRRPRTRARGRVSRARRRAARGGAIDSLRWSTR